MAIIPLEPTLPLVSSSLPRDTDGQSLFIPIRGLAPDGVCLATFVTESAVGSYPTVSPLLDGADSVERSLLCCTFLEVTFTGRYPASCPVEPGLSSKSFDFATACFTVERPYYDTRMSRQGRMRKFQPWNEEPQPQVPEMFGFPNLNPAP